MNIQTEHLEESHVARLTVEVETDRIQKAFEAAARSLSKRANIPGFRKGKAPYQVIVRYFGTQGLLEESIENIADGVYKDALKETGINPYTSGSLDDIKTDPGENGIPKLTLVFNIPKQPDVQLNDYRALRIPYEPEEVTDTMVDRAIQHVREGRAVIEPTDQPAKLGDKVHVKVTGTLEHKHVDFDLTDEEIEKNVKREAEVETEPIEEDEEIFLRTGEEDEIMPGFSEQVAGMKNGETKEFTLEFPEDSEYDDWANHTAKLKVEVSEIRNVTLPELNDEFASTISNGELATLLDYRMKVRADLTQEMNRIT